MDRRNPFYRQAALVVRVLPHVARREEFALKGGTAINLFLRDLPRLSIDIDLTYLPRTPRKKALPAIRRKPRRRWVRSFERPVVPDTDLGSFDGRNGVGPLRSFESRLRRRSA